DGATVARQETLASAAPRDGQPTLTGERVTAASQPTAQTPPLNTQAPQPTPQAPTAPSRDSAPIAPPLPADGATVARQETLASAAPRDGQPTLTGERVAEASQLAAQAQQATQTRPTPSAINALPVESSAANVSASATATSQETMVAQPLAHQPGMHALSPLNTALAPTPTPGTEAMAGLLAEVDANSSANKGSEQPIPVSLASQQPAAPNSLTATTLNTPVTSPAWPSQLGQQLIQFAQRGGEHQVKMQLHPAELGPLSITLKVTEQGAQAHFLSSHAAVRQVIEQAIPQLREALAEQGISLDDTSVGEQQNPNEQSFAQQMPGKNAGNQKGEQGNDSAPSPIEENSQETPDGRVDIYA
ncbi:flagellar hook-length control protein FliK, partial [Vreelandella alkaliphila]